MTILHVLDQNETLIETLENKPDFDAVYWDDLHHRALKDNVETYEFTTIDTPANRAAPYLVGKNKLVVTDHRGNQFLFIIEHSERTSDGKRTRYVQAYGDHYRLRTAGVIEPTTLTGATLITAGQHVLSGTEWQVGIVEYSGIRTVTFDEYTNPLKALHHIASTFDIELRFRVEFDGNRIAGKYVDFLHPVEIFDGKEIVYSKDMVGIRREETTDEVYTTMVGVGPADEDGNFLTFESINNGKNYIEDAEAVQRWGRHWYVYSPETEDQDMTAERLKSLTETALRKHIESIVKYTVQSAAIDRIPGLEHENVELGYQVRIKDEEFNPALYLTARVIDEKRSYTDPTRDEFEFGNYVEHQLTQDRMIANLQKTLFRKANRWDASTRTIRSDTPPNDKTALWIDTSQSPNVPKTWDEDAQEWVKASPTEAGEVGAETPQGAQDKADQAKQEAIDYSEDFVVNYAQKQISSSATPPEDPEIGDLWFDNSTQPPTFRRWNGTEWEKLSATTFEELEGMIDKSQLPDRVIDSMKLAIDAVQEENLAENSVYAEAIQAEAVGAQAIAANAILAKHIAAGEVTANHLAAEAVTADAIAAGAILSQHLSSRIIESQHISTEGLTAIDIYGSNIVGSNIVSENAVDVYTYRVRFNQARIRSEVIHASAGVQRYIDMYGDQIVLNNNIPGQESTLRITPQVMYFSGDRGIDSTFDSIRLRADVNNYVRVSNSNGIYMLMSGQQRFAFIPGADTSQHWRIAFGSASLKSLGGSLSELQARSLGDSSYIRFSAGDFIQQSSRKLKKNIQPFNYNALDKVKQTTIYTYQFDYSKEKTPIEEPEQLGFVYEESPCEICDDRGGVSITGAVAFLWKAVQELTQKVETLERGN